MKFFEFFLLYGGYKNLKSQSKVMEEKPILEWFLFHEEHVMETQSLQGVV